MNHDECCCEINDVEIYVHNYGDCLTLEVDSNITYAGFKQQFPIKFCPFCGEKAKRLDKYDELD